MSNLKSELKAKYYILFKNRVSRFWRMVIAQVSVDYARKWRETVTMLLLVKEVLSQDKWHILKKNYHHHHHQAGL